MSTELLQVAGSIGPEVISHQEVPMVRRERWEELHRLAVDERVPIAELAHRFGLGRKTVRRCVREPAWRPHQRPARADVLLAPHAAYLRARVPRFGTRGCYHHPCLVCRTPSAARNPCARRIVRLVAGS